MKKILNLVLSVAVIFAVFFLSGTVLRESFYHWNEEKVAMVAVLITIVIVFLYSKISKKINL